MQPEALCVVAVMRDQEIALRLRFDVFGDDGVRGVFLPLA
jgi:hypothetical protein